MADGMDRRTALVLYGTETGTAQDLAEELGQVAERLRFTTRVAELDDASINTLSLHTVVVFVISTTGQGEFPSNARRFWTSLLKKRLPATHLQHVPFFLVGLGDTSYPKFNWAARKLGKRLEQLGASEMIESCEADEQGPESTDGAFMAWLPLFKAALIKQFPLPGNLEPISDEEPLPSKWVLKEAAASSTYGDKHGFPPPSKASPLAAETMGSEFCVDRPDHDGRPIPDSFRVTLDENNRLTPPPHWQDVRFMTMTTTKAIEYLPGDAISILPKNFPHDVSAVIHLMQWTSIADKPIKFVPSALSVSADSSTYSSCPIPSLAPEDSSFTLRALLTNFLDINAIPRRSVFSRLALYTTNSAHKERLLEFTLPQYLDEYYDYATRARRSILEILHEFDSVQIPWWEAVNVIPPLRGRSFSIASGGTLRNPSKGVDFRGNGELGVGTTTKFELLVAIVQYQTLIKKIRRGVCTRYLAALSPRSTLNVVLRTDGCFTKVARANRLQHLDLNGRGKMGNAKLLIGAGTGIAPLRALIKHDEEQVYHGGKTTPTTLFFGARNKFKDFFFGSEWTRKMQDTPEAIVKADMNVSTNMNVINGDHHRQEDDPHPTSCQRFRLITAFSRDQPRKIYIQDRLREHGAHVFDMLVRQCATVVVCGSSGAMPRAVRAALVDVLVTEGNRGRSTSSVNGHEHRNGHMRESDSVSRACEVQNDKMEPTGQELQREHANGDADGHNDEMTKIADPEESWTPWTTQSANQFLDSMEKDMRYLQETW